MNFLKSLKQTFADNHSESSSSSSAPPEWAPAPELSYQYGLLADAPEEEYEAAEVFCREIPVMPPRLLPSDAVDTINIEGCKAWGIQLPTTPRFVGYIQNDNKGGPGVIKVQTQPECKDVCLLSNLPITAGLYDVQGKVGVYYEILIHRMKGLIAIGTSCLPYPAWRLPGWNRLSAGLHLDDFRKFFEDPDGGRDYTDAFTRIAPSDTVGCGYEFLTGTLFYTYNGVRLPPAFTGLYLPRQSYDVFAAIGVEGRCDFEVNFGGEFFRWKEGNEWAWRVEGHVGKYSGGPGGYEDELPSYNEVRRM